MTNQILKPVVTGDKEKNKKVKTKVNLIIFSGDLDKVLAGFIIATSAASMGMEVTMFFTFWGLNAVKKDSPLFKGPGVLRKMLNVLNRGGARRLALSRFHMLGMGTFMMKKLMKDAKVPSVPEMIDLSKQLGVKMVACTTSLGVMGLEKEHFVDEVENCVGAAAFLNIAKDGDINLFI